ncbi:MAG TPA: hypothetical protein V6C78_06280 [Crinalium sp.]|jgi:hypothetical protein
MGSVLKYWRLVRIGATGRRQVEEVAPAKAFFQQQFPDLAGQPDIPDATVQRHLWQLIQDSLQQGQEATSQRQQAELCLRCYISNQVEQVCLQLEAQFGSEHGFTRHDLFPFVLDDTLDYSQRTGKPAKPGSPSYRSLATEVLESFDPAKAGLSTWVTRLVRHHKELNAFLLERGVYLVSDWAILNDTTPKQLQRILAEFHSLSPAEIQTAIALLQSYHQIYRQDRLKQRQSGGKGQCAPPTTEQLQRIAQILRETASMNWSPETTMSQLQTLATQLRQYRIYVRGGAAPVESLDQPENQSLAVEVQSAQQDDGQDEQNEFLAFYRTLFLQCLDQTLEQVTGDRLSLLQRKKPETAQQFFLALQLFHCRGQSMGDIANQVGLQAQYQVTRLLKLKEFRTDVRQQLLLNLRDRILEKAKDYADPSRLQTLDQQIETALDEQISTVMQQAEAEASIAKNRPLGSLFARRLCHYLDTRSATS